MSNDKQIQELASCFIDAANAQGDMESRQPLYRAQELRSHMNPKDYKQGLREAILQSFAQDNTAVIAKILEIEPALAQDEQLRQVAGDYVRRAAAKGLEPDEELIQAFIL